VRVPFIQQLLSQCSVLCLQEHWLSDTQIANLASISDNFLCTGVCGFDPSAILTGRPYGGCAVLWRSSIDATVDIIDTPSRRLCSVKFKTVDWELHVINVHLSHEGDDAHTEDFFRQLASIKLIINQYPHAHVIVCGDFNVDFARNWRHTKVLNDFCDRVFLMPTVRHCVNTIDYSFNSSMNHFRTLDHFIVCGPLFDVAVDGTSVLHRGDNLSDHDPVFLRLNLNSRFLSLTEHVSTERPAWYKADERDIHSYKTALVNHLALIAVPVEADACRNVMCTDPSHVSGINTYANHITEACIAATADAIPKTCMRDPKRVPGWSEYVEPTRQKSLFWHRH
jgi:exonuclease III